MRLNGKVTIITGANEGLGFSLSKLLVKKGCVVHGISRNEDKNKKAKEKIRSKNFIPHSADVSNYDQLSKVIRNIKNVDILINNAGVWIEGKIQDVSVEKISEAIDTNLKGLIYTTKIVLPTMLKQNNGYIINISSTSGLKGRPRESIYAGSKFGVQGFTRALQEDLKDINIKVAGFYPGGMNTSFFEKSGNPKENQYWMDTNKVAEILVFMLERDDTMVMDHVVLNKRKTKTSN